MIAAALAAAMLIALMLRKQWQVVVSAPKSDSRILAEHVVEKISTHDADGTFRYVSPVFAGLLGEYPGTLVGRHPREFAHPDDQQALTALWKRALQWSGAAATTTWRCKRHDGDYAWLESTARATANESAALGAIVCASRNVTERKQIEDAIRDSEQRFRTTLETVRLVAVGLDPTGRVTFCNDALCALTGWPRSEIIGENWFDKWVPKGELIRETFYNKIGTGDVPHEYEGEILCRDGSRRMIAWDTSVLRTPHGEVLGTASLGADVTERKKYEARIIQARDEAQAASRAKSDFLSRMSHELRTPLNSVIGFANVMKKNKSGQLGETDLAYLDRIIANGQHLLTLVNNVLDIAKVEAGRLTVTTGLVSVEQLLVDVVAQLGGQPRSPSVKLRAEVAEGMIPIQSDGVLLRQVLINLAGNALRFTHEGSIVLSAESDHGTGRPTRIHVRDTGIGISPDRQEAIFEPFEQADRETHRSYGGTGLGLSISKAICDALGYGLTVESVPGKGSTFTIHVSESDQSVPISDIASRSPQGSQAHEHQKL
jgi:PAS domain S-box-containing protein